MFVFKRPLDPNSSIWSVLNFEDFGAPLLIGKALVVINDIVNTTSTGFPEELNFEWIQRRLEEFGADFSSNEAPSRETLAECESRLRGLSKAWETRRYNLRGFLTLIPIILSKRYDGIHFWVLFTSRDCLPMFNIP
jgi:hypothetical protein